MNAKVLVNGKETPAKIFKTQRAADNYKTKNPAAVLIFAKSGQYIFSK